MNCKAEVDGVILVISCKKYLSQRVINNPYRLVGDSIAGWKIIYVISDKTLKVDYSIGYNNKINSNLLKIKCQDDYICLFKKLFWHKEWYKLFIILKRGLLNATMISYLIKIYCVNIFHLH